MQSQLVARDDDGPQGNSHWLLRVERESLNQPVSRERLQTALRSVGHAVQLAVEIGQVSDSPGRRNAAAQQEKQLAAEEIIHNDPLVQDLVRNWGGRIVPGSIKPVEQPKG